MTKILWLASFPKSGNTWLRAFLANYLRDDRLPVDINALPKLSFGDMRIAPYERLAGKKAAELSWPEINRLRPRVHRWFAASGPGLVPVKTHSLLTVVDGIPTITPEATFGALYVARNPFDVAVSFSHHYGLPIEQGVKAVCFRELEILPKEGTIPQMVSDWSTHVNSWRSAPGLYLRTLRYEDMVSSPTQTFGGVLDFLKMPKDRERLKRAIRHSSFKVLAEQERRFGFVERAKGAERFFRRGAVGSWREELSAEQVERIVDCHRETLQRLGYLAPDGRVLV